MARFSYRPIVGISQAAKFPANLRRCGETTPTRTRTRLSSSRPNTRGPGTLSPKRPSGWADETNRLVGAVQGRDFVVKIDQCHQAIG